MTKAAIIHRLVMHILPESASCRSGTNLPPMSNEFLKVLTKATCELPEAITTDFLAKLQMASAEYHLGLVNALMVNPLVDDVERDHFNIIDEIERIATEHRIKYEFQHEDPFLSLHERH